jgi:membrane-associated protease RseP (regulator of RpoE activity)
MDALRKQMQGVGAGAHSQSQGMSMQVGPNGVRVEIKGKNEKGEEESKVYEAPDLDSFKQKYPGVLEEHGLQFSFGNGSFPFQGFGTLPRAFAIPRAFPQRLRHGAQNDADDDKSDKSDKDDAAPAPVDTMLPPPEGKRLGVRVAPQIPDGVRQYLGLAEGEGLQVDEVQPDTLASKLGVQKGDIVTRIGGATIGSSADVAKALGAIDAGKKVVVTVIRRGQQLELEADKAGASKTEAGKLEKRATTGKDAGGEIR